MRNKRLSKSSGDNLAETSFVGIVSDQGPETTVASAIRLRATTSRRPRTADPCGGIPAPGASTQEHSNHLLGDSSCASRTTRDAGSC